MRLVIKPSYDEVSAYAAEHVIGRINAASPTAERPFVLGLPTGSSPVGMYRCIVEAVKEGRVSFRNVVTFNMDEYVGLSEGNPDSYHAFMRRHLFDHIDCPAENINILDGNAPDLEKECARYEEKIKAMGGIDLFVGGIGPDGHIAFNEPFSSFSSRTRIKTLTYDTRIANSRFFGGKVEAVPTCALTVGVATVMDSREVLILCSGHAKAQALQAAVEGALSQAWTVSAIQTHPKGMIVCDEDATDELKVKTYRYFKSLENEIQSCLRNQNRFLP